MKWPLFEYGAHSTRVYNSQFHTWGRVKKKRFPKCNATVVCITSIADYAPSAVVALRGGAQQTSMRNYVTT